MFQILDGILLLTPVWKEGYHRYLIATSANGDDLQDPRTSLQATLSLCTIHTYQQNLAIIWNYINDFSLHWHCSFPYLLLYVQLNWERCFFSKLMTRKTHQKDKKWEAPSNFFFIYIYYPSLHLLPNDRHQLYTWFINLLTYETDDYTNTQILTGFYLVLLWGNYVAKGRENNLVPRIYYYFFFPRLPPLPYQSHLKVRFIEETQAWT